MFFEISSKMGKLSLVAVDAQFNLKYIENRFLSS
jgi:hypothetical protein